MAVDAGTQHAKLINNEAKAMLRATNLVIQRNSRIILDGIDIAIMPGQLLSILGANGAGKSSLLSALSAELKISKNCQSNILIDDISLNSVATAELSRKRMVLPQKPGLAFDLSVLEVIQMGAYPFKEITNYELEAICQQAMLLAEIPELINRPYLELSGGEQQRVQFARVALQVICARTLSTGNIYMLLDEPTASLDPMHQQSLLKSLANLAHTENIGVLVILHDINLASRWSDCIALINNCQVVSCGQPKEVITIDNIKLVYGVDSYVIEHPDQPQIPLVVLR